MCVHMTILFNLRQAYDSHSYVLERHAEKSFLLPVLCIYFLCAASLLGQNEQSKKATAQFALFVSCAYDNKTLLNL